jgi:RHS repeat-associated protein
MNKGVAVTEFMYGMGHKRFYRHDQRNVDGAQVDTHTAYLGGLEKIYRTKSDDDSDLIEYKVYVGNVVITERSNAANNASTDETYLHKDHLGSPLTITNKNGVVIQQNVYDPWGKVHQLYRDDVAIGGNLLPTTRGYTGHEGLDGLDIIHMNGRIYDADIGRFLQADPHIQSPKNSQSYNRYAYVVNNPLSLTDPSGFFFKKLLKLTMKLNGSWFTHKLLNRIPLLKGIVSVALNFIPGCQVWCTAVFNAMSTFVATGSLNAAIKTGAISYATGSALQAIGGDDFWSQAGSVQNISANALVGGISASLEGGNFGHAFFSAGVASAFKPMIFEKYGYSPEFKMERVTMAAVIAGTASVISGGKFANGAVTGAFNQLFNGETFAKKQHDLQAGDNPREIYDKALGAELARLRKLVLEECGEGCVIGGWEISSPYTLEEAESINTTNNRISSMAGAFIGHKVGNSAGVSAQVGRVAGFLPFGRAAKAGGGLVSYVSTAAGFVAGDMAGANLQQIHYRDVSVSIYAYKPSRFAGAGYLGSRFAFAKGIVHGK